MISSSDPAVNDNRMRLSLRAPTNKVSLFGRLCVDPVMRSTRMGRSVVHFSMVAIAPAAGQKGGGPGNCGEMAEATCHHVVVADERLAKLAATRLATGSLVRLEGQLQTRRASHPSETQKIVTEIVIFGAHARLHPG